MSNVSNVYFSIQCTIASSLKVSTDGMKKLDG